MKIILALFTTLLLGACNAHEMVSRLLKGFAEQGWVHLGREQIDITDVDALKKFAAL